MGHTYHFLVPLACALFLPSAAFAQKIAQITLMQVKKDADWQFGNVSVLYANKKRVTLTKSGLCSAAKIAPDQITIGWIEGKIMDYQGSKNRYFPQRITLFRNGKRLTTIVPAKLFTVSWQFRNGGKQIAVSSEGSHGATHLELFDAQTGKKLGQAMSYDAKKPVWTKGLPQQEP
jgi:hypothetical protein